MTGARKGQYYEGPFLENGHWVSPRSDTTEGETLMARWKPGTQVFEQGRPDKIGEITDSDDHWYESDPDKTMVAYQVNFGEGDTYWVPGKNLRRPL